MYRAVGVPELWELATGAARRSPRIVDLQAPGGARSIKTSQVLPGVRADRLLAAAAELRTIGGALAFARQMERGKPVVQRLLTAAGVL